jgi:fructose-bisphosphate aldolase, class II
MALSPTGEIVAGAVAAGHGVAALNVLQLEHAEGIVAGAARAGAPVILQISENTVRYHGGLGAVGAAALEVARVAPIPTAVHLDHARSVELVREAVRMGLGSVMFDASELDYDDNVAATRAVVEECHRCGVWVEAELGEVGGKDGVHAPGVRTDPAEAAAFVAATGVDALAVAVGTSHAMATQDARIDLELIRRLHEAVAVPLVLHGSSGVPDDDLRAAVAAGMTKINISTRLNGAFTRAVRDYLAAHPESSDPRRYLGEARQALADEVAHLVALLRA